ncbi:MAG: hypothetical protein RLZZ429_315 [Bacteroidota bacterium]|jgi:hypothetical protein
MKSKSANQVSTFLVTVNSTGIFISPYVSHEEQLPNNQIFLILTYQVLSGTTVVYEFEIKGANRLLNETYFNIDETRRIMRIFHRNINGMNIIRFHFADDRNGQVTIFRRYDIPLSEKGYQLILQQGLNNILNMDYMTADALPDWYAA